MEKSIFLGVMGNYPINKVLDFLITYEDFDYPMKEIAAKSGVGYSTLKLFWGGLIKNRIVIQTRTIGNAKLFTLNKDSPIVKQFKILYFSILEAETKKELKEEIVV